MTVPGEGLAGAITIAESVICRAADALAVSGGIEESVTLTETGYSPALAGIPESCPEALRVKPGGREPASVQLRGGFRLRQ